MVKTSPFRAVHERLGARFAEYGHWRLPSDYGDPAGENRALQQQCAAFDLCGFGRIKLAGGGSRKVLDSITGSPAGIEDGRWSWAIVKGRPQENPVVVRLCCLRGVYTLFTLPGRQQDVLDRIRHAAAEISADCSATDITESTAMLGLYGPTAFKAAARILPFDMEEMSLGDAQTISFLMISVTVIRGAWADCDGLELVCPSSVAPLAAGAVEKYHKRENITPAGMDCLGIAINQANIVIDGTKPAGPLWP